MVELKWDFLGGSLDNFSIFEVIRGATLVQDIVSLLTVGALVVDIDCLGCGSVIFLGTDGRSLKVDGFRDVLVRKFLVIIGGWDILGDLIIRSGIPIILSVHSSRRNNIGLIALSVTSIGRRNLFTDLIGIIIINSLIASINIFHV